MYRTLAAATLAAASAACAALPPRTDILARNAAFKARVVAVAALAGGGRADALAARAVADAARRAGLKATSLDESDSGLADTPISLDALSDPRVLAQVRAATGADAVVLLTYDAGGASAHLDALDAASGDSVLRATLTPRAGVFSGAPEAARAAFTALATLAGRPPSTRLDDIPEP